MGVGIQNITNKCTHTSAYWNFDVSNIFIAIFSITRKFLPAPRLGCSVAKLWKKNFLFYVKYLIINAIRYKADEQRTFYLFPPALRIVRKNSSKHRPLYMTRTIHCNPSPPLRSKIEQVKQKKNGLFLYLIFFSQISRSRSSTACIIKVVKSEIRWWTEQNEIKIITRALTVYVKD